MGWERKAGSLRIDNVDTIFAWSLKLMMLLLLRLGQTSYHSDGEPRWEREGGRKEGKRERGQQKGWRG